jgi:hypothetical protein
MDFMQQNATPVTTPPYFQEYRDKGWVTSLSNQKVNSDISSRPGMNVFQSGSSFKSTQTISELVLKTESVDSPPSEGLEDPQLTQTRESRLRLLVREYEGTSSREDTARFDMLTHRIRRLSPRVSQSDFNELDMIMSEIEEISDCLDSIQNDVA